MLVTLSGMVMLSSAVQPENAEPPILVTLSGMVILASVSQPENAPPAIVFVPALTVYAPLSVFFASIKWFPIYKTSFSQWVASL